MTLSKNLLPILAASFLLTTLSGCKLLGDNPLPFVKITQIPQLPSSLADSCKKRKLRAGTDARSALARATGDFYRCSRKQRNLVIHFKTVRREFNSN